MEIRMAVVKCISYANKLKAEMLKKPEVPVSFHRCQCLQKAVSGNHFELDVSTHFLSRQLYMLDFVVVFSQTHRDCNEDSDFSRFGHCRVRNIKFKNVRGELFPQEKWNFDISNNVFLRMYEACTSFKRMVTERPKEFTEERICMS
jgi:hypothetical protein